MNRRYIGVLRVIVPTHLYFYRRGILWYICPIRKVGRVPVMVKAPGSSGNRNHSLLYLLLGDKMTQWVVAKFADAEGFYSRRKRPMQKSGGTSNSPLLLSPRDSLIYLSSATSQQSKFNNNSEDF